MIAEHAGLSWLVAGLVLMVAEVVLPGIFLMWIGIAALGAGLATLMLAPVFAWQVVVFTILAAASIALALRLRRAVRPAVLNTAESGLVGRTALVLAFRGREGRVRVGDSDWSARLAVGAPIPAIGAVLVVTGVDGTALVVGPQAG